MYAEFDGKTATPVVTRKARVVNVLANQFCVCSGQLMMNSLPFILLGIYQGEKNKEENVFSLYIIANINCIYKGQSLIDERRETLRSSDIFFFLFIDGKLLLLGLLKTRRRIKRKEMHLEGTTSTTQEHQIDVRDLTCPICMSKKQSLSFCPS